MERRHWALALLFTTYALSLFDRQIINVLAQDIKTELAISDAELGLLTGTAFGIFYAVMGVPLGRLGDRVNRVRLVAGSLVIWSGFTSLSALAWSYLALFVARIGVGVGEAGATPAGTALIADLFPGKSRNSAMSLMLVGAPAGSFLGLLIGGLVASAWGWRAAFLVAGLPGLLVAAVMLLTLRDPNPPTRAPIGRPVESVGPGFPSAIMMLLRRPGYAWLVLGQLCSVFLVYASSAWLPPLFIRVHAMSTREVGTYLSIAVGLGGAIGTLGAGAVCDLLRRRLREVESNTMMITLALCAPFLLATVLGADRWLSLCAMFAFYVCCFAFLGPTVTLTQNAATADSRALAIGVITFVATVLGLGVGLPVIGWFSDRLTPAYGPEAIRYALALAAAAGLIGAFAHWRARNQLRSRAEAPAAMPLTRPDAAT